MSSFKKSYIKIYLWQIIAFSLNFLAIFIVTPLLSDNAEVFGIYSVCVSLNVFLQYADLGFLNAGKKYAAEAYINNNKQTERKYVGTSIAIFASICLLLCVFFLCMSLKPEMIIAGIESDCEQLTIASTLLMISAFSIPVSILQKYNQFIYTIRIKDYEIQKANIAGSLIRIISVPTIFFYQKYDIVGYYGFTQIVTLFVNLYILIKSKDIGYGVTGFIRSLKFDKQIFFEIRSLALSGFIASLSWLIYYELDSLVISYLIGAKAVAIYAIGRSLQSFIRSIFGILYTPYSVRLNYFVGEKNVEGLKIFYNHLITVFSSITFIPVFTLILFSKPFVITWVGSTYEDSIFVVSCLAACYLFNYFLSPTGALLYALGKNREIVVTGIIEPIVFFIGIALTIDTFGVYSVAIFKLFASICAVVIYVVIVYRLFGYKLLELYRVLNIKGLLILSVFCVLFSRLCLHFLRVNDKSKYDMLMVICSMAIVVLLSLCIAIILNKDLKKELNNTIKLYFK